MELQIHKMKSQITPEFRKRSLAQNPQNNTKIKVLFEKQSRVIGNGIQMNEPKEWIQNRMDPTATNLEPKFDSQIH